MKKILSLIASITLLASCGAPHTPSQQTHTPSNSDLEAVSKIWAMPSERVREVSEQLAKVPEDQQEMTLRQILESEPAALNSQSYPGGLNSAEVQLCTTNLKNCWKTKEISEHSSARATANFKDGAWLGRQDAFRHAYWNAVMRSEISLKWATDWANAHEAGTATNNDKKMDLQNNDVGRKLQGSTRSALEKATHNAVLNGNLFCLNAANVNASLKKTGRSPCF